MSDLSLIKKLRETTGAGFLDCKNALVENNNDIQLSVDSLRKKGLAKATKKSSREAKEGAVGFYNQKGNGSFFVPIRSALKRKNEIYFFAGGGITEKSYSLKEWEETEIKLKHIKSIIIPK